MLPALKDRGSQFPGCFLLQRDCPRGFRLVIALPQKGALRALMPNREPPQVSHSLASLKLPARPAVDRVFRLDRGILPNARFVGYRPVVAKMGLPGPERPGLRPSRPVSGPARSARRDGLIAAVRRGPVAGVRTHEWFVRHLRPEASHASLGAGRYNLKRLRSARSRPRSFRRRSKLA
jgi:hypothetical protein